MRSTVDQAHRINRSLPNAFHNLPRELVPPAAAPSLEQELAHQPPPTPRQPLPHQPINPPQKPARKKKNPQPRARCATARKARVIQEFQMQAQAAAPNQVRAQRRVRRQIQMELREIEQLQKLTLVVAAPKKITPQALAQQFKTVIEPRNYNPNPRPPRNLNHRPLRQAFHFQKCPKPKKKLETPHLKPRAWRLNPNTRRCLAIGDKRTPPNTSPTLRPADSINPFSPFAPLNDQCRSIEVGERRRNL